MKIGDILNTDLVYTPVYDARGNRFVIPIPENVYPTAQSAAASAVGGAFEYMAQLGASFTGDVRTISNRKDDQSIIDGLCVQAPGFYVIIISGPLYDKGKLMEQTGDISLEFVHEVEEWMRHED